MKFLPNYNYFKMKKSLIMYVYEMNTRLFHNPSFSSA